MLLQHSALLLGQEHAGSKKEGYANMAPVDPGDFAKHFYLPLLLTHCSLSPLIVEIC